MIHLIGDKMSEESEPTDREFMDEVRKRKRLSEDE